MSKTRLHFLLIFILALTLTTVVEGKTTITVQHRNITEEENWFKAIKAEFEAANPDIEVQLMSSPGGLQYSERLTLLYAAGTAPDLIFNTSDKVGHILKGMALDLTPYMERDAEELDLKDFLPGALDPWNFRGEQMSIPLMVSGSHFFVNMDHLEDAALAPLPTAWNSAEWTWDDMVEYGKRLRRLDSEGKALRIGLDFAELDTSPGITWMFGGDWFAPEAYDERVPERIYLNTPQAIEAYNAITDLKFAHRVIPSPNLQWGLSASTHRFLAGHQGMNLAGAYWTRNLLRSDPGFRWQLAPLPLAKERTWRTYNDAMFISSETKKPEEAWRFMKFATSRRGLDLFADIWGFPPSRISSMYTWVAKVAAASPMSEMEVFQQLSEAFSFGRSWTDSIAYTYEIRQITRKHLLPMLNGTVAVSSALESAEREVNAFLSTVPENQ